MPVTRCTESQAREWLATWASNGFSASKTGRATGKGESLWRARIKAARVTCPDSGIVPTDVPGGMRFSKTTVQYDAKGNILQEWRRLASEAEKLDEVANALVARVAGKAKKLPPAPKSVSEDLLLEIPLMDVHFGKYCWGKETGTDYDLATAHRLVVGTTRSLVERAGPVGLAVIVVGGDYFHSDTRHNQTERSGHSLDVDTRHHKVWERAVDALIQSIEIASRLAKSVKLVVIRGNHDEESAYHLQRLMAAYYRNEKRVKVDQSPRPRKCHQHGTCMLIWDHGDQIKMGDWPSLAALEWPAVWAATTERVVHTGHIHKQKGISYLHTDSKHSVQVEHLESLSGTDAWHSEMGFVGTPQRAVAFLWDAKLGLRSRIYCKAQEVA